MRMVCFDQEDILHIMAAPGPEARSIELGPDMTLELDDNGQILGVEILNASQYVPDVRGHLARQVNTHGPDVLEYLLHEGQDDAASDKELLAEALEMLQAYKRDKSGWKSLDDFELELTQENRQ